MSNGKEITIIVSDEDYEAAMIHIANSRPGKPLVAVQMIRAVEGDQDYDLGPFERGEV